MDLAVLEKALATLNNSNLKQNGLNESVRLLHGRGRCYPSFEQITIDWFEPVILISQFKEQEGFDVKILATFLLDYFTKHFPFKNVRAVVFQDRSKNIPEFTTIDGCLPEYCYAIENGLKFHIDLQNYQNVGFFLDAKLAREKLASICQEKRVLNLFAFTCSFSVVALANGAKSVVNLDMGKGVLERGRLNHQLNHLTADERSVTYIKSDIFKAWKKLHKYGRYDVIVIDPPSFQKGSFNAEKDYVKIVKQLHRLLENKAQIIACLNSPFLTEDFLDSLFLSGPLNEGEYNIKKRERLKNPPAFCDIDSDAGLKVVIYDYERKNSGIEFRQHD
jgi:23S rRNA (cytosine1962-C5)-methyltransferase